MSQSKVVPKNVSLFAIPSTRLAEEMGRKIVMNIITVGFFSAVTKITSHEATRKAVETSVPPGTEELNLKAFEIGYNYGMELVGKPKTVAPASLNCLKCLLDGTYVSKPGVK